MKQYPLPPDDLPPPVPVDRHLRRQLEEIASQYFYQRCDRPIQTLLSQTEWYFTNNASALTLVICCPDISSNWLILKHISDIARFLEEYAPKGIIRVYPPVGEGTALEMRVDERGVYQESP